MTTRARLLLSLLGLPMALACSRADAGGGGEAVRWEATTLWTGKAFHERIRVGRIDGRDAIVAVDQRGDVTLVRLDGGEPRGKVIFEHGAEMTGLALGDVDPRVPGEELYVGAYERGESGGLVLQLVRDRDTWTARRILDAGSYVHTIEVLEPRNAGELRGLVVGTYAGEVRRLTPSAANGAWADEVVWRDPAQGEPESHKIKDITFLRAKDGSPPHIALVVFKLGRALELDLDHPADARFVHDEPGGLSRCLADAEGGAYLTGYAGRVLHLTRAPGREHGGFDVEVLDEEGAESGLRGIVQGRFPLENGSEASFAVFGYHALVRALARHGSAWEATTLFRDDAKGHAIVAADLVPGNDADELVIAGQSKRIVLLVARRAR